jgi:hypothetical protein
VEGIAGEAVVQRVAGGQLGDSGRSLEDDLLTSEGGRDQQEREGDEKGSTLEGHALLLW